MKNSDVAKTGDTLKSYDSLDEGQEFAQGKIIKRDRDLFLIKWDDIDDPCLHPAHEIDDMELISPNKI